MNLRMTCGSPEGDGSCVGSGCPSLRGPRVVVRGLGHHWLIDPAGETSAPTPPPGSAHRWGTGAMSSPAMCPHRFRVRGRKQNAARLSCH